MIRSVTVHVDMDEVTLPRPMVRFPVELRVPPGFRVDDPSTYPPVEGRLEYVQGRLWYMPPTGDIQQDVVPDVIHVLRTWSDAHPEFIVAGNEAGMILGGEARGADAAVWRRADVAQRTGRYRRVPPVLAVEVAGLDDDEARLRDKADWYLRNGVEVVWLVLPESREVVVVTPAGESRHGAEATLPPHASLPDLAPAVRRLFEQIG